VTLQRLTPILLARDLKETMVFYTDVLGFKVLDTMGDPPQFCALERDDVQLMFTWDPPHEHAPGEDHDHPEPKMTGVLYLYPDNVTALHDSVASRTSICEPLGVRPHGMREFAVLDPNGYRLRFGEGT